jgi:DNA-binding NarL/FixJ family response regulator
VHEEKSNKLNAILNSKQQLRYGRVESKELILKLLKLGKKRKEIANELNRNISTIDHHIRFLKKQEKI